MWCYDAVAPVGVPYSIYFDWLAVSFMNSLTRTEDQSLLLHYDLVVTVKEPYSEFFDLMLMPKFMILAIWITNFQSFLFYVSYY